jgi:hypothetical protein
MEDIMDKRLKLFYLVAIGWIIVMGMMTVLALRNTDPPASKAATPNTQITPPTQTTHRTPTDFKGPGYAEGLVTEYHEDYGNSIPLGVFTVVVDGVEYRAREAYGSLPTPIKPGYYQVVTGNFKVGIIIVFLRWQPKPDVVSGFIISERLVAPSE